MIAKVTFKEVGSPKEGHCSYSGENLTRKYIIDFFGIDGGDIEYYNIEIN